MSSTKYAAPLLLDLQTSNLLLYGLVFLHAAAIVVLTTLPFPIYLFPILVVTLIFIAAKLIALHALLSSSNAIVKIIWNVDDEWLLFLKSGDQVKAELQGDSFIHPKMTVLRFKEPNKWLARSVVLLTDNTDANTFRQLRVRLKLFKSVDDDD